MRIEQPTVLPIHHIIDEAADTRTFLFEHDLPAQPGQFITVWLPRVDEKPFSISYLNGGCPTDIAIREPYFGFTVLKVGPFTSGLLDLTPGDKLGIRGPYGTGFKLSDEKRIAVVSGGCGCAPTAPLAEIALAHGLQIDYIIGAKDKEHLMFANRMTSSGVTLHVATDDGSSGHKGLATDVLREIVRTKRLDRVYACGPEMMLKAVFDVCSENNLPCQISLERYMKCAIGVCGACALDNTGWRVCKEGPVFTGEQVGKIFELGKYHRNASGGKVLFA